MATWGRPPNYFTNVEAQDTYPDFGSKLSQDIRRNEPPIPLGGYPYTLSDPSDISRSQVRYAPLKYAGDVAQYEFDYFSGGQCQIWIGDVLVDDINQLGFNVEHPRLPIYGYSSVLYDTTTSGRVIVSGSFTINFKEAAYLFLILQRYKELGRRKPMTTGAAKKMQTDQAKVMNANTLQHVIDEESGLGKIDPAYRQEVKKLLDKQEAYKKGYIVRKTLEDMGLDETTYKENLINNPNFNAETGMRDTLKVMEPEFWQDFNHEMDARAEVYEDSIWGDQGESTAYGGLPSRADQITDFDIFLTYGDMNNQLANHTVRRLLNVELVGTSQAVEISGFPVQEAYTFIARDFR